MIFFKKKKKRNRQKVQVVVVSKDGTMKDIHGKRLSWDQIIAKATFIHK